MYNPTKQRKSRKSGWDPVKQRWKSLLESSHVPKQVSSPRKQDPDLSRRSTNLVNMRRNFIARTQTRLTETVTSPANEWADLTNQAGPDYQEIKGYTQIKSHEEQDLGWPRKRKSQTNLSPQAQKKGKFDFDFKPTAIVTNEHLRKKSHDNEATSPIRSRNKQLDNSG